jgi:hypothetical protein
MIRIVHSHAENLREPNLTDWHFLRVSAAGALIAEFRINEHSRADIKEKYCRELSE